MRAKKPFDNTIIGIGKRSLPYSIKTRSVPIFHYDVTCWYSWAEIKGAERAQLSVGFAVKSGVCLHRSKVHASCLRDKALTYEV